jgi:hypothetical protein
MPTSSIAYTTALHCVWFLPFHTRGGATTEKSAHPTRRDAPPCPWKTSVSTPLHLPLSTRLGEISLSLGVPSKPFFWPIWRSWYPQRPSAAQPPRPNFLIKGAPTGHGWRLAPATGGAPATFSAAAARLPQQSSRRVPGGDWNLRPAPLFLLLGGGEEPPCKSQA